MFNLTKYNIARFNRDTPGTVNMQAHLSATAKFRLALQDIPMAGFFNMVRYNRAYFNRSVKDTLRIQSTLRSTGTLHCDYATRFITNSNGLFNLSCRISTLKETLEGSSNLQARNTNTIALASQLCNTSSLQMLLRNTTVKQATLDAQAHLFIYNKTEHKYSTHLSAEAALQLDRLYSTTDSISSINRIVISRASIYINGDNEEPLVCDDSEIISIDYDNANDTNSNGLPFGQIAAHDLEIIIDNVFKDFDLYNADSVFYNKLLPNIKVLMEFGFVPEYALAQYEAPQSNIFMAPTVGVTSFQSIGASLKAINGNIEYRHIAVNGNDFTEWKEASTQETVEIPVNILTEIKTNNIEEVRVVNKSVMDPNTISWFPLAPLRTTTWKTNAVSKTATVNCVDFLYFYLNRESPRIKPQKNVSYKQLFTWLFSMIGLSSGQYSIDNSLTTLVRYGWFDGTTTFADSLRNLLTASKSYLTLDKNGILNVQVIQNLITSSKEINDSNMLISSNVEANVQNLYKTYKVINYTPVVVPEQEILTFNTQTIPPGTTTFTRIAFQKNPVMAVTMIKLSSYQNLIIANVSYDSHFISFSVINSSEENLVIDINILGKILEFASDDIITQDLNLINSGEAKTLTIDSFLIQDKNYAQAYIEEVKALMSIPEKNLSCSYRGNPLFEVNTLLTIDSQSIGMNQNKVLITSQQLKYAGSLQGNLKGLKLGGL